MITLDNISFEFGGRWLYQEAGLQIKPGDRIGLVGRNGTGKTTLLRLIMGDYRPTEGTVNIAGDTRIGYLKQEMEEAGTRLRILDVALEAFKEAMQLREKEQETVAALEKSPENENLVRQLAEIHERLDILDGYRIESKAQAVLAGLGFSDADQTRPYGEFSGGWRMRALLARLLLSEPDVLLLDEPTNHLDLPSIQWLEEYLRGYPGALVIVSHDRFFLDRLISTVVEIERQRFHLYKGNYSYYLTEREIRREQHKREYENQQKFISEAERFIDRFRAKATKAAQAQSKIKMLENLDRIEAPQADADTVSFTFRAKTVSGKEVFHLKIDEKSYGEQVVLKGGDVWINRGDKIALIGANGLGKSTVLRMVAGSEPFEGEARTGHNVEASFYAQHQLDALDARNDILQEMSLFVRDYGEAFVRSVLGGFLFTGDDVFKKISVLSGGEKSRVALAKVLLSGANFLLLDEPTNHLDIQSIQILVQALSGYEGTFITVSHDRHFLGEVATKIWYIEDKELKEYPGTYQEFESRQKNRSAASKEPVKRKKEKTFQDGKARYEAEKERKNRLRKLERDIEKAEKDLETYEAKKAELDAALADPDNARDFDKLQKLQAEWDKAQREIDRATEVWMKGTEEMEELQNE